MSIPMAGWMEIRGLWSCKEEGGHHTVKDVVHLCMQTCLHVYMFTRLDALVLYQVDQSVYALWNCGAIHLVLPNIKELRWAGGSNWNELWYAGCSEHPIFQLQDPCISRFSFFILFKSVIFTREATFLVSYLHYLSCSIITINVALILKLREIFLFASWYVFPRNKNNPPTLSESEVHWYFYVPKSEREGGESESKTEKKRKREKKKCGQVYL